MMKKLVPCFFLLLFFVGALYAEEQYLFSWTPVEGAVSYRVSIDRQNRNGSWTRFLTRNTSNTQFQMAFEAGNYRYRTLAVDFLGSQSPESAWKEFSVAAPPPVPEPVAAPEPVSAPEPEPVAAPEPVSSPAPAPVSSPEPALAPVPQIIQTPAYPQSQGKISLGIGPVCNFMDKENGLGIGGSAVFEYRAAKFFSFGTNIGVSYGLKKILSTDVGLSGRWYPLCLANKKGKDWFELGLGLIAGAIIAMPDTDLSNSRGSILAGLDIGARFIMGSFYIEPFVRGGYPFLANAGILFGYRKQ
ncbi:MAG: hypothetical protein LBM77_13955 [Spirochaetaceae bacterium]|jgi:hypothetical protein|nr:hypothetical protein [Spirochaetaceae bacterium]